MRAHVATRSFLLVMLSFLALASASLAQPYEVYCQDGIDNDGDGYIDANPVDTPLGNLGPDLDCQCFEDVAGPLGCTANDIGFVIVGLGTQTDGCVNASDTVGIQFGATLATTGNNRYDIGMWVALDGGDARTGLCARQLLVPPISFGSTPTAGQLNSGNGPFRNQENNACGDLDKFDDPDGTDTFNARYDFKDLNTGPGYATQPVYQISCGDATNGVLNISTCVGYDNQSTSTSCGGLQDAVPDVTSKCRCQGPPDFQSNIPVPNLALSCGCVLNGDGTVTCEMTYSNVGQGTCNQVSSAADSEFSCGTARYLRFLTTYPDADGDVTIGPSTCTPQSSGTTTANCPAGPGRGNAVDDGVGTITWTPRNDPGVGVGTLGWIGVNETERLRFTFDQSAAGPVLLSFPTVAQWSNDSSFANPVAQTTLTCSPSITTPVTLATFASRREGDELVVEWQTSTEAGNAAFNLYAEVGKRRVRLNEAPIPSATVDSVAPTGYEIRVLAEGLENARLFLEEVSVKGEPRLHGPFAEGLRIGEAIETKPTDWRAIRAENDWQEARRERNVARRAALAAEAAPAGVGGPPQYPVVDLAVDMDGIQRVTHEALLAIGADFTGVKATDLVVENRGAQVPVYVGGARTFGPGSYVEFAGRALDTLYTGANVYQIRVEKRGSKAAVDSTAPGSGAAAPYYLATARVARNQMYSFGSPTDDPWYDTSLRVFTTPNTVDVGIEADQAVGGPARLAVETWGVTDWASVDDHHLVTRFNGITVADHRFDGKAVNDFVVDLPEGAVVSGQNVLTLHQPGDAGVPWDFVAFEGAALEYRRAFVAQQDRLSFEASGARFEISGFTGSDLVAYREESGGGLTRLEGLSVSAGAGGYVASLPGSASPATYHVARVAALAAPAARLARDTSALAQGPAELLIVAHPNFIDGLAPLVAMRESQGYSVKVVDVRDVYARESFGVVDPEAIRSYTAWAYHNLGTRYLLLVGGDSYDYRDFAGTGSLSFVPSPYAKTGPYITYAPVDPWYGDVDGDRVPDIPVGRFPVRTAAELDSVIGKTLAYETKPYAGTVVLAADSFDSASATSFTVMSDALAAPLGGDWSLTKAYVDHDGVALAKGKLVGAIDNGVALTTYVGHSGPTRWTFQGLLQTPDTTQLDNAGAPTVVAQFGCWGAYAVSPAYDGMAHGFLLSGDRGAAAVLGATSLTETHSDRLIGPLLMANLARPGWTIGDALQQARAQIAASRPELLDVILGFSILGDPTLAVEP